jgi:hypothetical protein
VRTVLHLVRDGRAPQAVAERDWVVYLNPIRLAHGGSPHTAPCPLGALDHDQVVALSFAADLIVTW